MTLVLKKLLTAPHRVSPPFKVGAAFLRNRERLIKTFRYWCDSCRSFEYALPRSRQSWRTKG